MSVFYDPLVVLLSILSFDAAIGGGFELALGVVA